MKKTTAKIYIDITELWENTPKNIIISNIERFTGYSISFQAKKDNTRVKELEEITGSSSHTVRAWMNRSRKDAKIPLLKLCKISEYLNITVEELLSPYDVNNRHWEESDYVDNRQANMFNELNEAKYYKGVDWDVKSFIEDLDLFEDYSYGDRESQLMEDCLLYFRIIFRINSGKFIDNVKDNVRAYLRRTSGQNKPYM